MQLQLIDVVKIFVPTAIAFVLGFLFTPFATYFFYKYKMWKGHSRSSNGADQAFQSIHNQEDELNTPRVGGIIIWGSVLVTTLVIYLISIFFPNPYAQKLSFLSRNQTLIPFFTLLLGAILGLWDDLIQIFGTGSFAKDDRAWRKWKVFIVTVIASLVGSWLYYKLGMNSIRIPFDGELFVGFLIIPIFIFVTLGTWSGSVIDGLDGLSGGVLASIFGAYAVIAFANNQIDMAAFCGTITGAILAFLWYNIPPARFYMGETGMVALTVTLSTIAFLTDSVLILPVVAMPLVLTSLSVILQFASRRFRNGKKMFRVAPLHHHFQAQGWPSYKVTMRSWVFSIIFAIIGIILAIISK